MDLEKYFDGSYLEESMAGAQKRKRAGGASAPSESESEEEEEAEEEEEEETAALCVKKLQTRMKQDKAWRGSVTHVAIRRAITDGSAPNYVADGFRLYFRKVGKEHRDRATGESRKKKLKSNRRHDRARAQKGAAILKAAKPNGGQCTCPGVLDDGVTVC